MRQHNRRLSGPAIFMYSTIALTAVIAAASLSVYYARVWPSNILLWCGIVSFMVLYHLGLRIVFGELTRRLPIDYTHAFFRPLKFESKLYRLLRVKHWKKKVLTFDPAGFDLKTRTPQQVATHMAKAEVDHWVNQLISIASLLFGLIWGCWPAFIITMVLAMAFDAQFIAVQRYNRPIILQIIQREQRRAAKKAAI